MSALRVRTWTALLVLPSLVACTAVRKDSRRTLDWLDATAHPRRPWRVVCCRAWRSQSVVRACSPTRCSVNPAFAIDDAWVDCGARCSRRSRPCRGDFAAEQPRTDASPLPAAVR